MTTCGAQEAIYLALRATCQPGDVVAIESPSFFGTLQTIESLGLRAIEIPTHPRTGIYAGTFRRIAADLGAGWTPTMGIGTGCRVHVRADELPPGRLVLSVSKHFCAFIDGVLRDTHDCSRAGTRCVYGFWTVPAEGGK